MVAAFLQAELESPRWKQHVLAGLAAERCSRTLIDQPDLCDAAQNAARARVLAYRGYGKNELLFAGFPSGVEWQRVSCDSDDFRRTRVLNQPVWIGYTSGSRLASAAAEYLGAEATQEAVKTDVSAVVARLKAGHTLPEVILVGTSLDDLVILEGHARIMAAIQSNRTLPTLIGTSDAMRSWGFY